MATVSGAPEVLEQHGHRLFQGTRTEPWLQPAGLTPKPALITQPLMLQPGAPETSVSLRDGLSGPAPRIPRAGRQQEPRPGPPRASQRTQWWFQRKAAAVGVTARTSMRKTVSFPHHGALGQTRQWGYSVMLVSSILAVMKSMGHGPQSLRAGEPRAWSSTDPHLSPGGWTCPRHLDRRFSISGQD